jgi:hypothetical protein
LIRVARPSALAEAPQSTKGLCGKRETHARDFAHSIARDNREPRDLALTRVSARSVVT